MKYDAEGKVNYKRVVLTPRDNALSLRHKKVINLVIGELFAVSLVSIIGCFVPANVVIWLYIIAAVYMAGLIITEAGESTLKTSLFLLPVAVAVLYSPVGFYRGFLYFANQCLTIYNERFNKFVSLITVENCTLINNLQFKIVALALILWLIYGCLRSKWLLPGSVLCLVAFAIIGLGGLQISPVFCGIMVFAWIYAWGQKTAGSGSIRKNLVLTIPLLLFLTMIVAVAAINMSSADSRVSALKTNISEAIEDARFGKDTLSDGDMVYADTLGVGNKDTFQISFSDHPQELYLRGFVGGDFNGRSWEVPDVSLYHGNNNGIIDWLSDNGLVVPFQYGTYSSFINNTKETNTISVQNLGANRKYVYLPYQSINTSEKTQKLNYDSQLCSTGLWGASKYTVEVANSGDFRHSIIREDLDTVIEGVPEFLEAESVYSAFAKENYLTVSDEESEMINRLFFGEDIKTASISTVTTQVRVILQSLANYSSKASYFNGASDFVSWFSESKKDGNSAYYATVAVLAYRVAGIPSRYVEGYCYSGAEADRRYLEGENTIVLTDSNAHAWAEIYLDGVGWIPIEVTPGYYYANYNLQQVIGQPESFVNIADDQTEEELQGGTSDLLPQTDSEDKPEEAIVKKTVYFIGFILLVAIVIWIFYIVLELQAAIKRKMRRRLIYNASPKETMRLVFWDIFRIFRALGIKMDERRPYDVAPVFDEQFNGIERVEYVNMVDLLEKNVFGEIPLQENEKVAANRFVERMVESACNNCSAWIRLRLKYHYGYYI